MMKCSSSPPHPHRHLRPTQPPIHWIPGPFFILDKATGASAEIKNEWSYTSNAQYIFVAWCLIKHEIHLHGVVVLS
jgi:hypothetical protein